MKKKNRNRISHKQPTWTRKIQIKIETFRGELSMLEDLSKGINVKTRKGWKASKMQNTKWKWYNNGKEKMKQKAQVKAKRRTKFYRQKKIFKTDAKKFYW